MVAEAAAKDPRDEYTSGATAGEWTARRIRKLRVRNRKVSLRSQNVHVVETYRVSHRVRRRGMNRKARSTRA